MGKYEIGTKLRLTGTFTDPNASDAAVDPTVVYVSVKEPSGNVRTYQYNVDADVVKSATGIYYIDISLDLSGRYWYRWYSTGTGQASQEGSFQVDRLNTLYEG